MKLIEIQIEILLKLSLNQSTLFPQLLPVVHKPNFSLSFHMYMCNLSETQKMFLFV